jgi:hypothetical protein
VIAYRTPHASRSASGQILPGAALPFDRNFKSFYFLLVFDLGVQNVRQRPTFLDIERPVSATTIGAHIVTIDFRNRRSNLVEHRHGSVGRPLRQGIPFGMSRCRWTPSTKLNKCSARKHAAVLTAYPMDFDPDNPPISPNAVFVPSGPIISLRIEWHRNRRAGISVRPWREVRDEFIASYLAERKRTARTVSGQDAGTLD